MKKTETRGVHVMGPLLLGLGLLWPIGGSGQVMVGLSSVTGKSLEGGREVKTVVLPDRAAPAEPLYLSAFDTDGISGNFTQGNQVPLVETEILSSSGFEKFLELVLTSVLPDGNPFPVIGLQNINLQPNSSETFDLSVENTGDPISINGIGFNIQVAGGGTPVGESTDGPSVTAVDILTGTIFETNNNGLSGGGSLVPQIFEVGTLTSSGFVQIPTGTTKIASVTFDTTGFSTGTFSYTLNTLNGPTLFTTSTGDLFPNLLDGNLVVVPEAKSAWMAGAGLLGFAGWRWSRKLRGSRHSSK